MAETAIFVSAENALMALMAEISVTAEFRHFEMIIFGFGVSAKNIFRSHTNDDHPNPNIKW